VKPVTLSGLTVGALYAIEALATVIGAAMYKRGDRSLLLFLRSGSGSALLLALIALIVSVVVLTVHLSRSASSRSTFVSTLGWNACSIALMYATAEVAIRLLVTRTPSGPVFASTLLLPRDWHDVVKWQSTVVERTATRQTFLVSDPDLGWTIGASRQSGDYYAKFAREYLADVRRQSPQERVPESGAFNETRHDSVYLSSAEGLRSPIAGIALGSRSAAHRIALVGDSFTFGLEVRYGDTWGNRLEELLGHDYQVLNFGVDGYGVDQSYLRYRRDVGKWHPDIVILGVISDDFRRTMCVYGFLCFPRSEIPFAKPRFEVRSDSLAMLTQSLPAPHAMLAARSVFDLPYVERDGSLQRSEWDWQWYDNSYALRYVRSTALLRRFVTVSPNVSNGELEEVNSRIFRLFVSSVRQAGAIPIIAYFPTRADFAVRNGPPPVGIKVLGSAGVPYLDFTPCIARVPETERFVVLHYAPKATAAVANCLFTALQPMLDHRARTTPAGGTFGGPLSQVRDARPN
jgi:hypothetical protein